MNKAMIGSETEKNIKAAFAGESQARTKYAHYSQLARDQGDTDIAELFDRMSQNELAHALVWYKLVNEMTQVDLAIMEAASGESFETNKMYPNFAAKAREEGFEDIAELFEKVAHVEFNHELTFMKALYSHKNKDKQQTQSKEVVTEIDKVEKEKPYRCVFCGYDAESAMTVCPLCNAIGAFQYI